MNGARKTFALRDSEDGRRLLLLYSSSTLSQIHQAYEIEHVPTSHYGQRASDTYARKTGSIRIEEPAMNKVILMGNLTRDPENQICSQRENLLSANCLDLVLCRITLRDSLVSGYFDTDSSTGTAPLGRQAEFAARRNLFPNEGSCMLLNTGRVSERQLQIQ